MEHVITLFERGGYTLLILAGVAVFFIKYFWPWFIARDAKSLEMWREQGKEFVEALHKLDQSFDNRVSNIERTGVAKRGRERND